MHDRAAIEPLPLEPGDRLTRIEFEERYHAMPDLKKAELVEGVVYMPSPVRVNQHGRQSAELLTWLGNYMSHTPGTAVADNATVRLDQDNELQPDCMLFVEPAFGGQVRISHDDYLEGAPEFVAEVAASSASYDLGDKLQAYRRNGVREYVVWRVLDRAIDWFRLVDGRFDAISFDDQGLYKSSVFPGLWLNVQAMLGGDLAEVLATLQQGLASESHAQFKQQLEQQGKAE